MTLLDLPGDPMSADEHEPADREPRLAIVERGLMAHRVATRSVNWFAASAAHTRRFELDARHTRDRLLVTEVLDAPQREFLEALFREVIAGPRSSFMSTKDLQDALDAPYFPDLAIGVLASDVRQALVIIRGDLRRTVVPWAWFTVTPRGTAPDFGDVEVVDGGLTIRLGHYEASMDAILYEFDRDYRARDRQRQVATDVSFGASLRRLRIQRGLARDGFPGISGKEIARIERGDVVRPHEATIRAIADTLGVEPAEIETY